MLLLSWFLPYFGQGSNLEIAKLVLSAMLWWILIKQSRKSVGTVLALLLAKVDVKSRLPKTTAPRMRGTCRHWRQVSFRPNFIINIKLKWMHDFHSSLEVCLQFSCALNALESRDRFIEILLRFTFNLISKSQAKGSYKCHSRRKLN